MRLVVLGLVAACGGPAVTAKPAADQSAGFVDAVARHDVAAVRDLLHGPITSGGLWFADADCAKQFGAPKQLDDTVRDAFASCLTKIVALRRSERTDPLFDYIVATYDPGIEIELGFGQVAGKTRLTFIGYAGRRDGATTPVVTPAALEALRVAGERVPALPPATMMALDNEDNELANKGAYAWLEICVDAEGTVTPHAREASSPLARDTYVGVAQSWKFKPFQLNGQASPVCALERFAYAATTADQLPPPRIANEDDTVLHASDAALQQIAGEQRITPSDADKLELQKRNLGGVYGMFALCIDEHGTVNKVSPIVPTGLAGYDDQLRQAISAWRYKPLMVSGKVIKVCSSVSFRYTQR